ncbi:hypothetical protein BDV06DRAFT_223367 [Aspergillus oleicola]
MALPASDRDFASPSSSLTCLQISFSDLFLSCIPRRRDDKRVAKVWRHKGSHNPKSPSINPFTLATNEKNNNRCSHLDTKPPSKCTCLSNPRPASNTFTPSPDNQPTPYTITDASPTPEQGTITQTTTTSIRIVSSDTSSDYNSSSSLTSSSSADGYSISDYECRCGSGSESVSEYDCTCSWEEFDYKYYYGEDKQVLGSMVTMPLPPLPGQRQTQRKGEVKTRLIEETIREEDEDEYLAQQEKQSQQKSQQEERKYEKEKKESKPRRKSMIELLHLASLSSSNSSEPRPASTSSGLSLSFSNFHFRFPLPPFSTHKNSGSNEKEKDGKEKRVEESMRATERKRPMSMSALVFPTSGTSSGSELGFISDQTITTTSLPLPSPLSSNPVSRADFLEGIQFPLLPNPNPNTKSQTSLNAAPSPNIPLSLSNTSTPTKNEATPTKVSPKTKQQRRMGTILFPPSPLAMLFRSNIRDINTNTNNNSSTNGKSPFC